MAREYSTLEIHEIPNAFLISFFEQEWDELVEEELEGVISMFFFQTRNHIQIDFENLNGIPHYFLNRLIHLAIDLKVKKRVLVVINLPFSIYHYAHRFHIEKIFYPLGDMYRDLKPISIPGHELEGDS